MTPELIKLNYEPMSVFRIEYFVPLQVMEALKDDLEGKSLKKYGTVGRSWFYFLCTKEMKYDIVSALWLDALILRNKYDGIIPFGTEFKLTKKASRCIRHCIENGHALLPKLNKPNP